MFSIRGFMKNIVRPIAIAIVSVTFGSLIALILKVFFDIELSILITSVITFIFAAFSAFYLFPRVLGVPFQDATLSEYLHHIGFYLPHSAWKHILLGALLAVCTLLGILIGSLLTGRYELDWSTVNFSHTIFSINPGIWEEYFWRGVIMFVLLFATRSLKRAAFIQIVLFGLTHIKGTDLWSWMDVLSVMFIAVAFTYAAYKTRTLVAGIVFHFLHDAFLFLPQVPGGEYIGVSENIVFYASLWLMVGVACMLIKFSADRLGVKADQELYTLEDLPSG
ncbi:MAG: CPBP family intramembrane glutamic endopeptidase [Anaerolineales bacterium]